MIPKGQKTGGRAIRMGTKNFPNRRNIEMADVDGIGHAIVKRRIAIIEERR